MIFQSQITTTSKEGKNWGLIVTIGFHAIVLAVLLMLVIPAPQQHPLDPVIMVNFGEPDMGGPSDEMAGGSGEENTSEAVSNPTQPSTPDPEIIENPDGAVSVPVKKNDQLQNDKKQTKTLPKPEERKPEEGSVYTKKVRNKKGNGTGNANGDGTSGGKGDGLIPGNQGDPNGVPNGDIDGSGHLKKQYRPRQIKKASFSDEETDDPNQKVVYVIVTVSCEGIIKRVAIDPDRTKDTKNFKYISSKLKGEKFFDSRPNCNGDAKWPLEVVITPN